MVFGLSSADISRLGISTGRTVTETATGRDITRTRTDPTLSFIESGKSTQAIFEQQQELIRQQALGSVDVQELIHENLRGLGQASIDLSAALGKIAEKVNIPAVPQPQPKQETIEEARPAAQTNGNVSQQIKDKFNEFSNTLGIDPSMLALGAGGLGLLLVLKK